MIDIWHTYIHTNIIYTYIHTNIWIYIYIHTEYNIIDLFTSESYRKTTYNSWGLSVGRWARRPSGWFDLCLVRSSPSWRDSLTSWRCILGGYFCRDDIHVCGTLSIYIYMYIYIYTYTHCIRQHMPGIPTTMVIPLLQGWHELASYAWQIHCICRYTYTLYL